MLIESQKVIDIIESYKGYGINAILEYMKEDINKIQEPTPGHWTKDFICSKCGCKIYPMDIDNGNFNFCPNCGKKMEVIKND